MNTSVHDRSLSGRGDRAGASFRDAESETQRGQRFLLDTGIQLPDNPITLGRCNPGAHSVGIPSVQIVTDPGVEYGEAPPGTSASLLDRIRASEPAAWSRFVDVYGPLVYEWCRRAGLQPADAADAGQEVFAAVARAIRAFRRDRPSDSFRGWLYVITRNKIADLRDARGVVAQGGTDALMRMAGVTDKVQPQECEPPVEASTTYRRAIEAVRAEFEPTTWQAAWRVVVDGQRPAATAAELGLSVNAVYLAKSRVLRRLREEFEGVLDWPETGRDG